MHIYWTGTGAQQVAANLKRQRQSRGWALNEVEHRLANVGHRLSVNTLSKIENRQRGISVDDLAALATALEVTADDLMSDGSAVATRIAEILATVGEADARAKGAQFVLDTDVEKARMEGVGTNEARGVFLSLAEESVRDSELARRLLSNDYSGIQGRIDGWADDEDLGVGFLNSGDPGFARQVGLRVDGDGTVERTIDVGLAGRQATVEVSVPLPPPTVDVRDYHFRASDIALRAVVTDCIHSHMASNGYVVMEAKGIASQAGRNLDSLRFDTPESLGSFPFVDVPRFDANKPSGDRPPTLRSFTRVEAGDSVELVIPVPRWDDSSPDLIEAAELLAMEEISALGREEVDRAAADGHLHLAGNSMAELQALVADQARLAVLRFTAESLFA